MNLREYEIGEIPAIVQEKPVSLNELIQLKTSKQADDISKANMAEELKKLNELETKVDLARSKLGEVIYGYERDLADPTSLINVPHLILMITEARRLLKEGFPLNNAQELIRIKDQNKIAELMVGEAIKLCEHQYHFALRNN
jgi:hypothetical protein